MAQLQSTVVTGSLYISGSDPRVGIGTTSPDAILQIANNDGSSYRFGYGGSSDVYLDADNVYIRTDNGGANTATFTTTGLGIGTTSPDTKLEIVGADPILTIRDSSTSLASAKAFLRLAESGASDTLNRYVQVALSGSALGTNLTFDLDGNEKMRINESGNVGIGTTSPNSLLHIDGDMSVQGAWFWHSQYESTSGAGVVNGITVQWRKDITTLSSAYMYKVRLTTSGTGTNSGATYIVNYNPDTTSWEVRAVNISGNTSNHPLLAESSGTLVAYTNHSSSYPIRILTETYICTDNDGTFHNMGADFHWQRSVNNLFYNDGNVGIGTASPATKFEVRKDNSDTTLTAITSGNDTISLLNETDTTNNYTSIGFVGNAAEITARIASVADASNGRGNLVFLTGDSSSGTPAERMRIDSSGRLFLGTATVAAANAAADDFVIKGEGTAVGMTISNSSDAGTGTIFFGDSTSSAAAGFRYNHNTGDMAISAEDNITITADRVGIGVLSPDDKLHVGGNIFITDSSPEITLETTSATHFNWQIAAQENVDGALEFSVGSQDEDASNDTFSPLMIIKNTGYVGIGVNNPPQKLTVVGTISGSSDLSIDGDSVFDGTVGYNEFNSGFGGTGWRIDSSANAEFQNLTVRGTFSVYELLAQQIRATNGSLLVATSGKVQDVDGTTLLFDSGSGYGHGFVAGDVLISQRLNPVAGVIERTFITVASVANTGSLVYTAASGSPSTPQPGQEFVRIGHTSNADRQGHIYLTADDTYAPYIGVRDGLSGSAQFEGGESIEKVRVGRLDGITSSTFGSLSGYGFWAKGDAYLEGGISATFGNIGGFGISADAIFGDNFFLSGSATDNEFFISSPKFNIKANGDVTGSRVLFTGGDIGGFSISQDALSGDNFYLSGSATGNEFFISSSNFNVKANGDVTASNANIEGRIVAETGFIGTAASGFDINSSYFRNGTKTSYNDSGTGVYIGTDGIGLADTFSVSAAGALIATNATITGDVTANNIRTPATIGGAPSTVANASSSIDSNGFAKFVSASIGGFDVSADAIAGDNFYLSGSATGNEFFISSSNFNVKANGDVTASNATISGDITATSGTIGGWTAASTLSATNILLDPVTPKITLGDKASLDDSSTGAYIGTDGLALGADSVFKVTNAGTLTATDATISGTITITGGDLAGVSGNSISGSFTETSASIATDVSASAATLNKYETQVVLDTNGMQLKNAAANVTLASYGTTTTIGQVTGTNKNVFIDSNSVQVRRGTQVSASFGGTSAHIGPTAGRHVLLDSDSFDVKNNTSTLATFGSTTTIGRLEEDGDFAVQIDGSTVDILKMDDSSQNDIFTLASFGTTTTIGSASVAHVEVQSSGVKIYGSSATNSFTQINNNGLDITRAGTSKAFFGSQTRIGEEDSMHLSIGSFGFNLDTGSNADTRIAKFGTDMRVGLDAADKTALRVDSSGNLTIGTSGTTNFTAAANGDVTMAGSITATSGELRDLAVTGTLTMTNTSNGTITNTDGNYIISSSGIILASPSGSSAPITSRLTFKSSVGSFPVYTEFNSVGDLFFNGFENELALRATSTTSDPSLLLQADNRINFKIGTSTLGYFNSGGLRVNGALTVTSFDGDGYSFNNVDGSGQTSDELTLAGDQGTNEDEGGGVVGGQDGTNFTITGGKGGDITFGNNDAADGGDLILKPGAGGVNTVGSGNPGASGSIQMFGNVGIGTSSPGALLELKESSNAAGDAVIRLRGHGLNADNTVLGALEFFNADSSGDQPGVAARLEAQSGNANGHMGELVFKTHDGSEGGEGSGPVERMRIDATGKVGIGITSPIPKLHVYQNDTEVDTAAGITIEQDGTGDSALSFLLTGIKRWRLGIDNSDSDKFKISDATNLGSSNRFTIDTSGNVGIGTTSPSVPLEVDVSGAGDVFKLTRDTGTNGELNIDFSGANANFVSAQGGYTFTTSIVSSSMAIDSNGNVGISTSSPTAKLQVDGDVHIGSASNINSFGALQLNQTSNVDEEGIAVLSAAGGRSIRIWVDESQSYINSGNGGNGNIILNEGTGNVGIGNTNPPEALTVEGGISASGDLHIQGNINVDGTFSPSGNLSISGGNVVLDSGQGIDFSATGQASGTPGYTPDNISEVLDDYEEGFWKPIFTSGGIASITNQDIVTGTYVKIGRAVHINAYLRSDGITKNSNTSSPVYINNLPFSPDDNEFFSVEVGFVGTWAGDHPDGGYIDGSNSRIALVHRNAADGASTTVNAADLSTGNDANKIMFSATYFTD